MNELCNLDFVLAKFIHGKLIDFKTLYQEDEPFAIIYSHELESGQKTMEDFDISNDTLWFLDEMIWTFNTLQSEEVNQTFKKIHDEVYDSNSLEDINNQIKSIRDHPLYEQYEKEIEEMEDRISRNLQLFAKYFRHLWL